MVENSKGIDLNAYEAMKEELQNLKLTLKDNSVELENTKKLLSEKEVIIKNLEEELARCRSELDSREKKLNNVEAAHKSEIDRLKKGHFSMKRKNDALMKEKDDGIKENQSLLKQMEDLKSSQKTTSETALEQAIKEKDFRIQTLERTLEKERDDNKKEKAARKRAEKVFTTAVQNAKLGKKEVEESIEKHKQAVKEVIEHYPGISSQLPPVSALEKNFFTYFRFAKVVEESQFNDGAAVQTPGVETATVDVAAELVDTPQRLSKSKVAEERAVSTLQKPSTEVRRIGGRRPLVRPTLERTEEPQSDADPSAVEGSMVGLDKGGPSLEREVSGGVAVLQPSSRKRLTSSGEANEANPPLKRSKEEGSSQDTSELKNGQPHVGDVSVAQVPSTDDQDGQQPTEEMDTDQASVPIEEAEATREDDTVDKDDTDAHVDASMHVKSQDTGVDIDNNAIPVEDALVKSEAAVQLFDENQTIDDLKDEAELTTATDVEDEMEEGELPEEPEPLEIIAPEEAHREPSDIGEQAGNVFSAASPGEPTEKNELDISEIGEGDTAAEHATVESEQSPIPPSGGADASPSRTTDVSPVREPSPSLAQTGALSEQNNTNTVTGGREPSSNQGQASGSSEQRTSTAADGAESRSRTINLQQRALQNRQARMRTQQPARGRAQQSPQMKGATGRGSRGRGGRGQT